MPSTSCSLEEELNQEDCTLLLEVDAHRQCLVLPLNRPDGASSQSSAALSGGRRTMSGADCRR